MTLYYLFIIVYNFIMDKHKNEKLKEMINSLQDLYQATGGTDMLALYEQFSYIVLGYVQIVFNTFAADHSDIHKKSVPLQALAYGQETPHLYQEALRLVSLKMAAYFDKPEIRVSNPDVFAAILDIITIVLPPGSESFSEDNLEYLMGYLLDSCLGKSTNDYLATPAALAEFVLDILKPPAQASIFEPSCGSGAFLVAAGRLRKTPARLAEGNEQNRQWEKITRLNLMFHGQQADIQSRDIVEIAKMDQKFDYVISNPPFNSERFDTQAEYEYLPLAVPTNSRYRAFIQVILQRIKNGGKGAVVVPDSFLFDSSQETVRIRRWLLDGFLVEGIISLPRNTFYPKASVNASVVIVTAASGKGLLQNQMVAMLDRRSVPRRNVLEPSDLVETLKIWHSKDDLRKEWSVKIQADSKTNLHGATTPVNWKNEGIWFAGERDIQQLDCSLLPSRYQPAGAFQMSSEDPHDTLREILGIERQILDALETLEDELRRNG